MQVNQGNRQFTSREETGSVSSSLGKIVKGFDLYSRVDESFAVKTDRGAMFTIVAWVLIVFLCLNEVLLFSQSDIREHLVVDSSLNRKLSIYLNMTLHGLHCPNVHLDSMDIAGDSHLSLEHSMIKQRLDLQGNLIGSPVDEYLSEMEQILAKLPPDYCGSCYGAENPERECCNTCSELMTAYREKGWSSEKIYQDSEQCKRDATNDMAMSMEGKEGCRLSGFITINKVAGNVHMALGESIVKDGRHLHSFKIEDAPKFNTSHTIHQLEFLDFDEPDMEELHTMLDVLVRDEEALRLVLQNGLSSPLLDVTSEEERGEMAKKEGAYTFSSRTKTHSPLNQFESKIDERTGLFQYYIKLIPTVEEGTTFQENLKEMKKKANKEARVQEKRRAIDAYWSELLEEDENGETSLKNKKGWIRHLNKLPHAQAGSFIVQKGIEAMRDYADGKLNTDMGTKKKKKKKKRNGVKLFDKDFLTGPIPVRREDGEIEYKLENPYLDIDREEDDAIVVLSFPEKAKNQRNKENKETLENKENKMHYHAISSSIHPHHYTFTRKFRPLISLEESASEGADPNQSTVLPGIFFSFDFSPFMIEVSSSQKPWLHLVIRCISIVGGVLTILRFVDSFSYQISKKLD